MWLNIWYLPRRLSELIAPAIYKIKKKENLTKSSTGEFQALVTKEDRN
jgi:hypothetical protein